MDEILGVVIRFLIHHGVANRPHETRSTSLPRGLKERVRLGFSHFIKQGQGFTVALGSMSNHQIRCRCQSGGCGGERHNWL